MNKFEKIKTIADKRIAVAKRGKLVANDFQAGDSLFITEKVDGITTKIMLNLFIKNKKSNYALFIYFHKIYFHVIYS